VLALSFLFPLTSRFLMLAIDAQKLVSALDLARC
jgi:hypothetical protein